MAFSQNIVDVHEATFERDVIQKSHEKTVVVDFWAAWCGPCRMLGPILERLADEDGSNFILAKVDVDKNQGLAMRYGVQGIPAVKAFRNGEVAGDFVGALPEPRVRDFIKQVAPGEADRSLSAAETLLAERDFKQAESLFRHLLASDGDNPQARIGLARALIARGKGCEAASMLEDLSMVAATMAQAERLLPVAKYVCTYAERGSDGAELTVVEAQYRQASRLLGNGKVAPALDGLLDVLRFNKNYRDGEARRVMLGIFELLGDDDPATGAYRREMASVLF